MKRYSMSFGASLEHKPDAPERTARRTFGRFGGDVQFQVWPSRAAMARSIRMQQKRENRPDDWRACVKLTETEGY